MADLSTTFMGIALKSPIVAGASSLSKKVENIQKAEAAGAGALVIKSLFQEQIELEGQVFEDSLRVGADSFAEALSYFPDMQYAGADEHVMWVRESRKAVSMPLIASINARSTGAWVEYARKMEDTGVNGLELNFYSVETRTETSALDIEKKVCEAVAAVKQSVKLTVAVKLSPYYTAVANMAQSVVDAGADGLTLFNRFYQPDISADTEKLKMSLDFSTPAEARLPLRWIAILSEKISTDFAASTGIHSGKDVARFLLAGASVAQVVSALYLNGIDHLSRMNAELNAWMDQKGYATIADFQGKITQTKAQDAYAFERAQYINLILGFD